MILALSLLNLWRFRTGWRMLGEHYRPGMTEYAIQIGFASIPFLVSGFGIPLIGLCGPIASREQSALFGYAALLGAALFLGASLSGPRRASAPAAGTSPRSGWSRPAPMVICGKPLARHGHPHIGTTPGGHDQMVAEGRLGREFRAHRCT